MTKRHLQAIVEGRNPFAVNADLSAQATIAEAFSILGALKVISAQAYAKAWGLASSGDVPLRYTIGALSQAAEENISEKADWRLVYLGGLCFIRQRELRGAGHRDSTRFDIDADWCLEVDEKKYWQDKGQNTYWAERDYKADYYLVDCKGRFGGLKWQSQESAIRDLGNQERCFEEVFSEFILTINMVTKGRICMDWLHCGRFINRDNDRVGVRLGHDGVFVGGCFPGRSAPHVQTALFRKFDV